MNSVKIISLAAIAGLSFSAAQAATINFNDSISVTETGTLSGANVINLSQFDSDLGTLNSVTLNISLSLPSFNIVVDNDATALANVNVNFGTIGSVLFSSSVSTFDGSGTISGSNFTIATQVDTFDVAANDSDSALNFDNDSGPDNGTFTTGSVNEGVSTWLVDSAVFAAWQASSPGTIAFEIAADFVTDLNVNSGGGGGDTRFQGTIPSATFTVDVTYDYTPVPEPSTFALLSGVCALGFLAIRRRRA